jgi:hypothetical protein
MHAALLLAFLLPIPLARPTPARTDLQAWRALETAFRARGVAVVGQHPRCAEAGLYGLYVRGSRTVVVCPRGDRSDTLRHEGWHLVQSLCLGGKPWLNAQQVQASLSRQDRRDLQRVVAPDRLWREAEARAMARLSTRTYLAELERACADRLPQQVVPGLEKNGPT